MIEFNEKGHIERVNFGDNNDNFFTITNPSTNSVIYTQTWYEEEFYGDEDRYKNTIFEKMIRVNKIYELQLEQYFRGRYRLVYLNMFGNIPFEWVQIKKKTKVVKIVVKSCGPLDMSDYALEGTYLVQFETINGKYEFNTKISKVDKFETTNCISDLSNLNCPTNQIKKLSL